MTYDLSEDEKIKVDHPDDLYKVMQAILLREQKIDQDREHAWVVAFASNRVILNIERIATGSVKSVSIEPMEVFSLAIAKRARSIVLVHNHPSGELEPSKSDMAVTDRLYQSGRILGTPLTDHFIISTTEYLSFFKSGLMKKVMKSNSYKPPYVAMEDGLSLGIEKGMEKGLKKGAREIARLMKVEGLPTEQISKLTGLTKQQVRNLKIPKF